jgi:alpha-tubulin suppressor-like RCC1 family protein
VSAGDGFACAVVTTNGASSNGEVVCWGANEFGELGSASSSARCSGTLDGFTADLPCSPTPQIVTTVNGGALVNVISVSAGQDSACALTESGGVLCWGDNAYGQLGNGGGAPSMCGGDVEPGGTPTYPCSSVPMGVTALTGGATAVSVGDQGACAVTASGAVACWGRNDAGQVGSDGSNDFCIEQTPCYGPDGHPCQGSGLGNTIACALVPTQVTGIAAATSVSVGGFGACALTGGEIMCWGDNSFGELGNGGAPPCQGANCPGYAVQVTGLSGVTALSTGASTACAIASGAAWCWGLNGEEGQLGHGPFGPYSFLPVMVETPPLNDLFAISVGSASACAAASTGTVECWGDNTYGELAVPPPPVTSDVPVTISLPVPP